jgi:hypothetical protein
MNLQSSKTSKRVMLSFKSGWQLLQPRSQVAVTFLHSISSEQLSFLGYDSVMPNRRRDA